MMDLLNNTASEEPIISRTLESRAKQSRTMTITQARKRGDRPVDIALRIMGKELGVERLSQRQLRDILIKRYLEGES